MITVYVVKSHCFCVCDQCALLFCLFIYLVYIRHVDIDLLITHILHIIYCIDSHDCTISGNRIYTLRLIN